MQLKREGFRVNHKVVMRLMKEENLTCKVKRSRYNSYKGEAGESKSNIIKRNFKAATANKKWATDVTEFKAAGKKLYLKDREIKNLIGIGESILYLIRDSSGVRRGDRISAEDFAQARRQQDVQALCDEWKSWYDAAKRQGIPAYVVNGKYLLLTANLRGVDQMAELIDELNRLP